eukprot:TRINITY_DN21127_c0_g1_i1.p1 TRINITY_DN21127_c0_g1~~TRINITY_DN21127_c0_g1_i1.p1  ORF type:complete len:244 (-),score=41.47 TRINITY_DN21127_c0_g1_i1:71-802(-)
MSILLPESGMERLFLAMFLFSTPVVMFQVFVQGGDKGWWAIANSYAFSIGYNCLYLWPLIETSYQTPKARIHRATMNWLVWLSVFTEVMFQIPHNLATVQLEQLKGTVLEWPFFAYGFADSRWNQYNGGSGLEPAVWLINVNDAGLGVLVALALFYSARSGKAPSVMLILVALFRDATLWRETVEYMWDHHRHGYPFTTTDPALRPHAIACLWLVNICWLIAPCMTVVWAYLHLDQARHDKSA